MSELIGEVQLRNPRRVYREGANYRVEQIGTREQIYSKQVKDEVVEYLCKKLVGCQVTSEEAADVLKPVCNRFNLPYTYGEQLKYYAQEVLVVLVALGKAGVKKERRRYWYTI